MTQQTGETPAYVPQGILLLDERARGWEARADPEKLDMEWHGRCLLCQLYGSYAEGIRQLDIGPLLIEAELAGETAYDCYGWEYGFTIPPTTPAQESGNAFARLTRAWKQVIGQKRRASASGEDESGGGPVPPSRANEALARAGSAGGGQR